MSILGTSRILPVISLSDASLAIPLAEALLAGGMDAIELTLRTSVAFEALEAIARDLPQIKLGMGTVLRVEEAQRALDCGAHFTVSPAWIPDLVVWSASKSLQHIPAISGPDGAAQATLRGISLVKLFPAEVVGGLSMVRALGGPFPGLSYLATGGIGPHNLSQWIGHPSVQAVGGTWLAPDEDIRNKLWGQITKRCREALAYA